MHFTLRLKSGIPSVCRILFIMAQVVKNPKIGDKIGRLTLKDIKEVLGDNNRLRLVAYCICDCGKELEPMPIGNFGNKRSCGCLRGDEAHGLSHTKVWSAWQKMKSRCYSKTNPKYYLYGAAGRFVCNGLRFSFKHFLKIMGEPPSKEHSNDRKNNNGNYTCGECEDCIKNGYPLNIHWATPKEQSQNQTTNHKVIYNGKEMCFVEACREAMMPYKTVFARVSNGWSFEKAISKPINLNKSHKINKK